MNLVISGIYLFVLLLAVVVFVRLSLKGSNEQKPMASAYLKIFLNHF